MIRLSKRLKAVADFVPPGSTPADIGTDHAYLPIYLVQTGRICGAIAADVREGPLAHARKNIAQAGLEGQIRTVLSDGLEKIPPDAADTLVIAGMGGMLLIRILDHADLSAFTTLVLAPQSDLPAVRRFLADRRLRIEKETLVCEDGKYYPVLCAVHGTDTDDDPVRLRYGKHLLPQAAVVLRDYLRQEHASLTAAMTKICLLPQQERKAAARNRCDQLAEELRLNETAQERIRQETAQLFAGGEQTEQERI